MPIIINYVFKMSLGTINQITNTIVYSLLAGGKELGLFRSGWRKSAKRRNNDSRF